MLTNEERNEIEQELCHIARRELGTIDALLVVQRTRGYVSDDAVCEIAGMLGVSPAELDSVATFYNGILRRPVGRHTIQVCDSVSCYVCGGEEVMAYLKSKLGIEPGETTADNEFTLLPAVCLGHCEQAPVMMLDGDIVGNLTPEKIDNALEEARKK